MVRESRIAEGSAPTHCRADRTCVRDLSPLGTPWVTNSARTARLCPTRRWWQLGRLSGGWDPAGFTLAPGPQSGYQVGPVSPGPSLSVRCPPQSTWPFLSPLAPSVHVTHSLSVHRPLPSAQPAGIQESSPSSLHWWKLPGSSHRGLAAFHYTQWVRADPAFKRRGGRPQRSTGAAAKSHCQAACAREGEVMTVPSESTCRGS